MSRKVTSNNLSSYVYIKLLGKHNTGVHIIMLIMNKRIYMYKT
jgi:hypothetical protein